MENRKDKKDNKTLKITITSQGTPTIQELYKAFVKFGIENIVKNKS